MRRASPWGVFIVALWVLLVGAGVTDAFALGEALARSADPVEAQSSHSHGDPDDEHDAPSGPCHHRASPHVGHSHVLAAWTTSEEPPAQSAGLLEPTAGSRPFDIEADRIPHVPII